MKLVIVDQNNWEKSVAFDKAVVRVGSSQASDVQISSPGIAPTHLQFHYLPEDFGCKLLNLGNDVKILRGEYEDVLLSYARTDLENGDEIILGEYRLRVQLPMTTRMLQGSRSISASLSFPNTTLYQHTPMVGWLTVKNIGVQSPCQFHVAVSGLPADCVKIDPIPLLYSGAQEEVRIQFFHRGIYPYAGLTELSVRIFAPTDYPGEQVLIEQGIYVMPVFDQKLEFVDEASLDKVDLAHSENLPDLNMIAQSTVSSIPPTMPPPPPQDEHLAPEPVLIDVAEEEKDEQVQAPVEAEQPPPPVEDEKVLMQVVPEPRPVVVRDLPEEFWDEE